MKFVTISQSLVLMDQGFNFLLKEFKSRRLSIIAGDRALGGNSLHRRRGIFFHPGAIMRGGGFRAVGVEWGGKGVSTPHPSAPLSTRHHRA